MTPRQVLSPETNSKKKVEHEFIGRPSGPKINNLVASKADPVLNKAHNLSSPLLEKPKGQIRNRELTQPGLGRIQNGLSNSKMITKGVE